MNQEVSDETVISNCTMYMIILMAIDGEQMDAALAKYTNKFDKKSDNFD